MSPQQILMPIIFQRYMPFLLISLHRVYVFQFETRWPEEKIIKVNREDFSREVIYTSEDVKTNEQNYTVSLYSIYTFFLFHALHF